MGTVVAYHLVITAYGFWLPNDPRGSWSRYVRAQELRRFGPATKVETRRNLARDPHDWKLRQAAKQALSHRPVEFSGLQARDIARGIAAFAEKSRLTVFSASILPKHLHLVIEHHRYSIEQLARLIKGAATSQLIAEGRHPFRDEPYSNGKLPSPWTRHEWKVFLFNDDQLQHAIEYVDENPEKDGFAPQHWSFTTPRAVSGRTEGAR